MTPDRLHSEMELLLRTVAEETIMPRYQSLAAHEIVEKARDDLVTVADREAEERLAAGLASLVPGLAIVGEEAVHGDPSIMDRLTGDCWIIDPLDGTNNFAAGKPPFGIMIAMASGGETHTGWIYDILTRRLCVAHRGKGAFIAGERIVSRDTGNKPPIAANSLVYMTPRRRAAVSEALAPYYTLVDIPRCAAEQYPRLVLGQNDVAIFERTLPWDHATGSLFVNEAGGKVARPDGSPYRVDEHGRAGLIGAASERLWHELAERLADTA